MARTLIESIDASMSELFRMHDYRGMYEYYLEVIKPELDKSREGNPCASCDFQGYHCSVNRMFESCEKIRPKR